MKELRELDLARWRHHIAALLRGAADHSHPEERWRRAFGIVLDELKASLDEQRAWVHELLCDPSPYGLGLADGKRLEDVLFGDDPTEAQAALDGLRPDVQTLLLRFNTDAERATFTSSVREVVRMHFLVRAARHANPGEDLATRSRRLVGTHQERDGDDVPIQYQGTVLGMESDIRDLTSRSTSDF